MEPQIKMHFIFLLPKNKKTQLHPEKKKFAHLQKYKSQKKRKKLFNENKKLRNPNDYTSQPSTARSEYGELLNVSLPLQ